jgi:hypothetical protein
MTCLECSNPLSEDVTTCPFCGAPVESEPQTSSEDSTSPPGPIELPRIWNPWVLVFLEMPLLGGLLASAFIALNWHSLKQRRRAIFSWCLFPVILGVSWKLCDLESVMLGVIVGFLVWFLALALPQILYLRTHYGKGYIKRSWIVPACAGLAFQIALPKILLALDGFIQTNQSEPISEVTATIPTPPKPAPDMTVEEVTQSKSRFVTPVEVSWEETHLLFFTSSASLRGSAVLYAISDGVVYFVTNKHVVTVPDGASNVTRIIKVANESHPFEIVSVADNSVDLALLKITLGGFNGTDKQHIARLNEVAVGQECVAIGNTLGEGISATTGIISRFDDMGGYIAIRTSAPISPGNSGGALFRRKDGALIGITTSMMTGGGAQNVNFAIPIDYVEGLSFFNQSK